MDINAERLRRLAEAVTRSKRAHTDTIAARNTEMLSAYHAGLSVRAIAKATGLSPVHTNEILVDQAAHAAADNPRPTQEAPIGP